MKELYPFKSNIFILQSLKYHYLDEGQGTPVIMLHGNPTWSFYYRNLVKALKDRYRIIVPDHIGCGLSDKPGINDYPYTLRQRVDDLEALLDHLGIKEQITLVLHDWGGMIGMCYAARYPDRIARLVVFNTAAFHLPKNKQLPLALKICRNTSIGAFLVKRFNLFALVAARIGCKQHPMSPALRKAYCAPYDSPAHRVALLRFVQDIPLEPKDPGYDLVSQVEDGLPRFSDLPTLICWGLQDFVFDHHFLKVWRSHFPDAEVHPFRNAGHYILEDAADQVIPMVVDFLQRHPVPHKPRRSS